MHMNMEATGESWVMLLNGLYLVFYSYLCVLCVCARMKGMCHFVCFPISCSDYPFVCNGEHGAGAWRQACLASVRSWIPFPAPALKQKSICNGETHCRVLRLSMRQKLTSGEQPKIRKEAGRPPDGCGDSQHAQSQQRQERQVPNNSPTPYFSINWISCCSSFAFHRPFFRLKCNLLM